MSYGDQAPPTPEVGRLRAAAGWWPLPLICAGAGAVYYAGASHVLTVEMLRGLQSELRLQAAQQPGLTAVALIASTAIYLMLSLPAEGLLTAVCGMLFGTVLGSLISTAGAVLAALMLFLGLRLMLRRQLKDRHGPKVERVLNRLRQDGFNYLLMARLLPVLPFALISLAAVLARMRFWPYMVATAIAVVPPTVVFASAGSGLGALLAEPGPLDFGRLVTWRMLLPLGGLALLAVAPVGVRRWRAGVPDRSADEPRVSGATDEAEQWR